MARLKYLIWDKMPKQKAKVLETVIKNCFAVLTKSCTACKKKVNPEAPYEWLLVASVKENGSLDEKEVNIIKADEVQLRKSMTINLGKDGGKNRVSLAFLLLFPLAVAIVNPTTCCRVQEF